MFKSCSPYIKMFSEKGIKWNFFLTDELLNQALEEDRLIFLHIGYISNISIRESSLELFSNSRVVSILNREFINVIEDKEDKPESFLLGLDLLFLNQDFSYGPINMFIMPNRKPIIAFSDCDPENFLELANSLLLAKNEKRDKLQLMSEELSKRVINTGIITEPNKNREIDNSTLDHYIKHWFRTIFESDFIYKLTPFTPNPSSLITIIDYLKHCNNQKYSEKLESLLDHLQFSQLFDPIDGGFFRQSKDYSCVQPLFEKTLEENSQFLLLYAKAYKFYRKESYRDTVYMIYQFIVNELVNSKGGLMNSTTLTSTARDAVYYSFSVNELALLFPERYKEIAIAMGFDITLDKMIKQLPNRCADTYDYISREEIEQLRVRRSEHRGYYMDIRAITSSNAVAVSALSQTSLLLNDNKLYYKAIEIFDYIIYNNVRKEDGKLYRYTCCTDSYLIGYLSDYAHFIEASLELYKIRKEQEYLQVAKTYTQLVLSKFYKQDNGMFNNSETDVNYQVIPFKRESNIDVIRPSSNSVMAGNLITLYELEREPQYLQIARQQLLNILPNLINSGPMLSNWAHKILKYITIS